MRFSVSVRLCALLLVICLFWAILGAPLSAQEWRGVPDSLRQAAVQAPLHAQKLLTLWLLRGALPSAQAASVRDVKLRLRIWDEKAGRAFTCLLEDYVAGVVAAEMPARYHPQALRCQAVAARTRAAYACLALSGNGCARHPDCDLCTSSACCQGYLDKKSRAGQWGEEASVLEERVLQAVRGTAGQVLTWDGLPIEMLYHACSGGATEDASAVFAQSVPYLVSVASPGEEGYAGYSADETFSCKEAVSRLEATLGDCGLSPQELSGELELLATTSSGRVARVRVGQREATGVQFRQALGLRSTRFTWDVEDDHITFHTIGYGHGVGMSQAGAQAMAADGKSYAEILTHYYPGALLQTLPASAAS